MNEIELLKKMNLDEFNLQLVNHEIYYEKDPEKLNILKERKEALEQSIKQLEERLSNIEDNQYSIKSKSLIIGQLKEFEKAVNNVSPELKIDKSQGSVLEEQFASIIIWHIKILISEEPLGIFTNMNLYFTRDDNNSIEVEKFKSFLMGEIDILNNMETVNYIKLKSYYDEFCKRLLVVFR